MPFFSKKEQIVIILLVVIIIAISLFNFLNKNIIIEQETSREDEVDELIKDLENEDEVNEHDELEEIMVHISGQVHKPGIVRLKPGDRVIDAVNLAGGLKKDADLDKINLAKKLADEEKIYVPKIGEDKPAEVSGFESSSEESGKVNINTSTKEELLSLPGIGEVLADRILDYRKQNPFKSIEDLMNVSGIGEKRFESIKELITVQ